MHQHLPGRRCNRVCDGPRPHAGDAAAPDHDGSPGRRRCRAVRADPAAQSPHARGCVPTRRRGLPGLMTDRLLRWGVLSTAKIAREKWIPGVRRGSRGEVVAIGSRDEQSGRAVAAELGIPRAHGSYEALLADPEVDAVYIPVPNHLHREWTLAAARAGKHVLCEKPLALTSADAEEMVRACEAAGVLLMEAFMYRLHPSWAAVRR